MLRTGQVGDKTKSAEQVVEEERLRLEQLEKRRLKRMQGEEVEDDDGAAAVPAGGFAARRAKRRKLEASAGLTGGHCVLKRTKSCQLVL